MKLIITGSSGFSGQNIIQYFKGFEIEKLSLRYYQNQKIKIEDTDVIIHLAGKVHDLKKVSKPQDYYEANFELTKQIYDAFLKSDAKVLIMFSSVKAVADDVEGELTEERIANPKTHYGISKFQAEQYIFGKGIPQFKKVYILRPCMIHGPGNKGNLNILFKLVNKSFPWPLGDFENKRSFCSIENLCFIIKELIERDDIPSGIYNVADDEPISTNELIELIAVSQNKKPKIISIPQKLIKLIAKLGDVLKLPLNSERLQKLTESYIVSNHKIKIAIGKPLPISAKDGLMKTFQSFNKDVQ